MFLRIQLKTSEPLIYPGSLLCSGLGVLDFHGNVPGSRNRLQETTPGDPALPLSGSSPPGRGKIPAIIITIICGMKAGPAGGESGIRELLRK